VKALEIEEEELEEINQDQVSQPDLEDQVRVADTLSLVRDQRVKVKL
jgi:hypothetical protein